MSAPQFSRRDPKPKTTATRDKVDGVVVTEASHPELLAAHPGLKTKIVAAGGSVVVPESAVSGFYQSRSGAPGAGVEKPGPDLMAAVDTYLALRRDPKASAAHSPFAAFGPMTAESLRAYGYSPAQAERMIGGPPDTKVTPEAVDAFFAMRREARAQARR